VNEAHLEYAWFFRAEFPGVLRTVFLILHDRGRSEDVTQEAFIQLLAHWKKRQRTLNPSLRTAGLMTASRRVQCRRSLASLQR